MKKTVITVLKFVVSFGILFFIARKVGAKTLWETLQNAHPLYFIFAVLSYFVVQGLSAYRWFILLKPLGLKIGFPKILSLYFLGMYFNLFLPTAIGGDAVRIYYLHKEARRLSHSTASVFLDRDLGMGALLIMATVIAAYAGTSINGIALAPIFLLIMIAFAFANLAIFYRPTYNLLHRLLSLTKMKSVDEKVESLFNSVNAYRGQGKVLTFALLLSLIIQIGGVYANILVAQSIDLHTTNGWFDFMVFIPAISLISMNPLSVAGTGWREYSYKIFFESVGATEPQAATLGLLWLGVMVATSLPGGIIYVLKGSAAPEIDKDGSNDLAVNEEVLEISKT
ncbi:MAG: lysylphosphatidylglycerol synthase transmembrane domain-containing protein [Acidobacteriota bacterium]